MALIKCPECKKDVSSKAISCTHCGYPLEQYVKDIEHKAEVKRLLEKILPTEFHCPDTRLKVCIKCGSIFFPTDEPECECGFPGVEVDYPVQQRGGLEVWMHVFQHDVIPRSIGDTDSDEYKESLASIKKGIEDGVKPVPPIEKYMGMPRNQTSQISQYLWDSFVDNGHRSFAELILQKPDPIGRPVTTDPTVIIDKIKPVTTDVLTPLLPHCPFCSSTDLTKLSSLGKAAKVHFFGLLGVGDLGKTYKCNNCGGKF